MYLFVRGPLLTSMRMFGDKQVSNKHSRGLSFVNLLVASMQPHCKLLRDTLVTSRHIGWIQMRSTMTSIQTALRVHAFQLQLG